MGGNEKDWGKNGKIGKKWGNWEKNGEIGAVSLRDPIKNGNKTGLGGICLI